MTQFALLVGGCNLESIMRSIQYPRNVVRLIALACVYFVACCDDGASRNMQGPVGIVDTNPTGPGQLGVFLSTEPGRTNEIKQVLDGGPASDVGVRIGDRITAVTDVQVSNVEELKSQMKQTKPRETIEVTFNRDGETFTAKVELISYMEMMMLPGAMVNDKRLP